MRERTTRGRPRLRRAPALAAAAALTVHLGAAGSAAAQARPDAGPLAITHVRVVPMDRERVLEDHTVVTDGGRIVALGPASEVEVPAGARVIDGRGRWLVPGLVDSHIHTVAGAGEPGDGAWQQMALLVANGVTTARSLAGAPTAMALREAVRRGDLVGPRLYLAGPSLHHGSVATPEAAVAAVEARAEGGFDVIKTHGVASDVYDAMVEAARRAGLPLSGHVTPDFGLERALAAGQQIEHLDGYLLATIPEGAGVAPPPGQLYFGPELDAMTEAAMPALARATAEAGVWNSPTLALFEIVADPEPAAAYRARPEMAYVPEAAKAAWAQQIAQVAAEPVPAGRRARYLELRRAMVRALRDAGAGILAGSDSPQFFMAPGFALQRELRALQAAGLTPFEALTAATTGPAAYLGGDFGTIAVGKAADLVLLGGDPLEDVANAADVEGVVLGGRWVDARALLEQVKEAVGGTGAGSPGGVR